MKKVVLGILIFVCAYLIYHYRSVQYGLEQAYGQIKVLGSAVPLEEYLKNEDPPAEIIDKINLIQSVKSFAEDSLGLQKTSSYTSIYDQKGKAILWMVTACPEFDLEPYQWSFPIAGKFEYKGFFNHDKAKHEAKSLQESGYDTDIGEVSAWSTLGFFSDPILSSMLEKDSGRLADLIIHELCHASIYLRDSVELNENLASFIGKKGAEEYLLSIKDTSSISKMRSKAQRRKIWAKVIHSGSKRLDSLYKSFSPEQSIDEKRALKKKMIDEIRWEVAESIHKDNLTKVQKQFAEFNPNNAFFTGYLTYRSRSNQFEKEFEERFDGNLKRFIEYYIKEHGK